MMRPLPLVAATTLLICLSANADAQTHAAPAWQAQVDSLINAELARTGTPGAQVAVAVDGQVVYTRGYGVSDVELQRPVTEHTLFRVGSVTKVFAGTMLAVLAERGSLDLHAPIARYVPELAGRRVGAVTTHQLLTHTAGWIDNAVPYGRSGASALGEVMVEVTDTLFFTDPGRVISYSNPGYSMAGYVGERAGGRRFASLTESLVLRPLGMPRATFDPLEAMTWDFSQGHVGPAGRPAGVVRPFTHNSAQSAAGFLFATARDLARLGIALMDSGRIDGEQVLPAAAVRRVVAGYAPVPGDSTARYGYGLMQARAPDGLVIWQHGGAINGFDANLAMFPEHRLAVAITDNRGGPSVSGDLLRLVARSVKGLELPRSTDRPARRLATAAERRQIVGRYGAGRTVVEIVAEGDSLIFRQNMARLPAFLRGDDALEIVPPVGDPQQILLVRDASGRVSDLHLSLRALSRLP